MAESAGVCSATPRAAYLQRRSSNANSLQAGIRLVVCVDISEFDVLSGMFLCLLDTSGISSTSLHCRTPSAENFDACPEAPVFRNLGTDVFAAAAIV